jgi:hypothetical protein
MDAAQTIQDRTVRDQYRRALKDRLFELWRRSRPAFGAPKRPAMAQAGVGTHRLASGLGARERRAEEDLLEPFLLDATLVRELDEDLADLELADPAADRLRRQILDWYSTARDLGTESLRSHLARAGLERMVDEIVTRALAARDAMGERPVEEVRDGWRMAVAGHQRRRPSRQGGADAPRGS